jgi:uncharacterized protein YuzE
MSYDPEVDSAYYQLDTTPGIDSEEIAEGIIVDYDTDNNVVGVELLGLKTLNHNGFEALYPLLIHECFHQYHYQFMKYHKLKIYQVYGYNNTTFIEGFAHYMEIYCDDKCNDDNYYSILRKIRLVADTGINYYGWTYKKTFNFMKKYLSKKTKDIINEIDRYPGLPEDRYIILHGLLST